MSLSADSLSVLLKCDLNQYSQWEDQLDQPSPGVFNLKQYKQLKGNQKHCLRGCWAESCPLWPTSASVPGLGVPCQPRQHDTCPFRSLSRVDCRNWRPCILAASTTHNANASAKPLSFSADQIGRHCGDTARPYTTRQTSRKRKSGRFGRVVFR